MLRSTRPGVLLALLLLSTGCATSRAARPVSAEERADYETRLQQAQRQQRAARQEDFRAALESLAREVGPRAEKHPEDAGLQALLARTALLRGEPERARVQAERVRALVPEGAEAHYLQALLLGASRRPEDALVEARRATELEPGLGRAWQLLGTILLQLERAEEALAAFSRALALEPREAQSLMLLGLASLDAGRPDEALAAQERALALEPDFVLALIQAGQLLQKKEQFALALERFQRAVRLEPRQGKIRAHLVQVYQALGQGARRDAEREALLALRQQGLVKEDYFVREQLREGTRTVVVVENFELTGDWAKRYEFQVYAPGGEQPEGVISLGAYAFIQRAARARDPSGPPRFHLDAYHPDGTHATFGLFEGEPSYDDTRARVLAILRGQLAPLSSSRPGAR